MRKYNVTRRIRLLKATVEVANLKDRTVTTEQVEIVGKKLNSERATEKYIKSICDVDGVKSVIRVLHTEEHERTYAMTEAQFVKCAEYIKDEEE